ncbi:OmpH family outer membrane protein [Flavobacterium silvisoli]|uniref:OmpH family outer membrane protein n=1 Tax=Flavobacterium silvisoli TaxID=2529433 RepID=A0A4Q9Z2I5_9FLAO|nr:OmpH family outer membrane protein [Flavobacterium silvisoli]TBX69488.1 OmpH family outer membrane protein [Flavobacterium silvisoli]
MKKYFAISLLLLSLGFKANAQSRGIKIGYIDMEYILQNVPDYAEAKNQLEQKAQKWKQDIEAKKVEIAKLKDALKTERALLTKELIDEREEEIKFQEDELLDFQQKKFGPDGDLITQKAVLVKPIQDQVFTAVQDIAEVRKYDFIFDKSSDLTMLFAAKRHDISDQVVRAITRAEKREQLSKKQLKEQEKKEYQEDVEDENPTLAARRKALDEKKAAREKLIADRKAAAEQKKADQEAKRKTLLDEKAAKKTGTVPDSDKTSEEKTTTSDDKKTGEATSEENTKEDKAAARAKLLEDRKKAAEERRKKIIEDREAAKKAKEEKSNSQKTE